ncbi:hypothetical protein T484DRAFT_1761941, partial [Baffinella frigidus]
GPGGVLPAPSVRREWRVAGRGTKVVARLTEADPPSRAGTPSEKSSTKRHWKKGPSVVRGALDEASEPSLDARQPGRHRKKGPSVVRGVLEEASELAGLAPGDVLVRLAGLAPGDVLVRVLPAGGDAPLLPPSEFGEQGLIALPSHVVSVAPRPFAGDAATLRRDVLSIILALIKPGEAPVVGDVLLRSARSDPDASLHVGDVLLRSARSDPDASLRLKALQAAVRLAFPEEEEREEEEGEGEARGGFEEEEEDVWDATWKEQCTEGVLPPFDPFQEEEEDVWDATWKEQCTWGVLPPFDPFQEEEEDVWDAAWKVQCTGGVLLPLDPFQASVQALLLHSCHDPTLSVLHPILEALAEWSDGPPDAPAMGREPSDDRLRLTSALDALAMGREASDDRLRSMALDLLNLLSPESDAEVIASGIERLADSSEHVRHSAVALLTSGLITCNDGPASEKIMLRLTHPDAPVRAAAAKTLRAITTNAHLPTVLALARAYARSGLAATRVAALGLLQDLAPPHAGGRAGHEARVAVVRAAVRAIADPESEVRARAALVLAT